MALTDNGTTMLVQPSGYGGGDFGGFGGGWWIILLLLCGWGGMGGFGGGFGGGYDFPWILNGQQGINNNVSSGFRDAMLNDGITSISDKVTSGFGDVQTALCGGFAGVTAAVNGAANGIANQLYSNEIASLNRSFAEQTANMQGFSSLASQLAQCCCDNRLATCQSQNLTSTEAAATRSAIQSGVQTILDKMCQDKIDAKNEKIVELNNRINSLEANNYIQNALTAQSQYFLALYPPTATTAPAL